MISEISAEKEMFSAIVLTCLISGLPKPRHIKESFCRPNRLLAGMGKVWIDHYTDHEQNKVLTEELTK